MTSLDAAAPTTTATPQSETGSRAEEVRVVLVVRDGLPTNIAVNAAAVLGASIGTARDLPRGPAAVDASETRYAGIVTTPVPVLVADSAALAELFGKASAQQDSTVLALTEVARRARTYQDYLSDLAQTSESDADIVALIVAGRRNQVTKITKRLSLLPAD